MNTEMASPSQDQVRVEIDTAPLHDAQTVLLLRNKLKPLLPYSLPLLRRCQFYLHARRHHPRQANVSNRTKPEVWIATSRRKQNNVSRTGDWLDAWLQDTKGQSGRHPSTNNIKDDDQSYWIASYIDITEPGQTQVWLFGSWEPSTIASLKASSDNTTTAQALLIQYELFQRFYHHLRKNHIPFAPLTPSKQWLNLKESGKIISLPYIRSKVLFGTLSEALWWIHDDWVVKGQGIPQHKLDPSTTDNPTTVIAREDRPYLKYIWTLPPLSPSPSNQNQSPPLPLTIPETMHFAPLSDTHLQTVLDRSVIPRTLELLRTLTSTGLFTTDSPDPIAWGILGKDASLSSLHTEPEYRGRRFAELVSRELCRRAGEVFSTTSTTTDDDDGVLYMHTDVSTENTASQRVFEKMGAEIGWRVGWIEVDVGEE